MKTYSFADAATGVFSGRSFSGPADWVEDNTLAGTVAVEGLHDPRRVRLDVATGEVVQYMPPAPTADEWRTWSWIETEWSWAEVPTPAAIARDAKAERDRRLTACVGRQLQAIRTGAGLTEVNAYIAALVGIDSQAGFPLTINWPLEPWA